VKNLQSLRSSLSEFFDRGLSVVTTVSARCGRPATCELDETPIDLEIELAAAAGDEPPPWWPHRRGLTA